MRSHRLRATVLLATTALVASAGSCAPDPDPRLTTVNEIIAPKPGGTGSVAPELPAAVRPAQAPVQAGPELAGRALPTNQWWTSALTGPLTQPMWAFPLAVKVAAAGVQVSSASPVAAANAIITPFQPAVTAGGPVNAVRVTGYGDFHVVLTVSLSDGGSVQVTLVQGSPVLYLRFVDTPATLWLADPAHLLGAAAGAPARLDIAGARWDAIAPDGARWESQGSRLTALDARDGRIALARVPDHVDEPQWTEAVAGSALDPVTDTRSEARYDRTTGTVTQTLTAVRASGRAGVWALLPHHRAGLVPDADTRHLSGEYPHVRGDLSLVTATAIRVRVAMPGLLPTVPAVGLPEPARAAVLADLDADLAEVGPVDGSYFGFKELARLATIAEVAGAISASDRQRAALDRLRPRLVDWLTYNGSGGDDRYFGYDTTWGGLVAVPAEFGSQDYNDHHFQYGYLVRAAAVLASADPEFATNYGPTVDLVVREYAGTRASKGAPGFPPFRVFNAYAGNSAASGFAPFADGNNQESVSEAVAAWEAAARWGLVRDDADLTAFGLAQYALEAASARRYWLGERVARPAGYGHTGAGIVWDAKVDYATWFDPRPESIAGIQLLPLTFGSLYRSDATAAAARATELARDVGGPPRVWGDLFAVDLALADPAAARARLTPALPREESTSRALVRYLVETLATWGPPQPAVTADGPYGLAFGSREAPVLVAVNPTGVPRTVAFRRDGRVVGALVVQPGQSAIGPQ